MYLYIASKRHEPISNLELLISVLAIGDGLFNFTRSLDQLTKCLCINEYDSKKALGVSIAENALKLFCNLFILFFIYFRESILKLRDDLPNIHKNLKLLIEPLNPGWTINAGGGGLKEIELDLAKEADNLQNRKLILEPQHGWTINAGRRG